MTKERNEFKVVFANDAERVATKRKFLALFQSVQFKLEDGRQITARVGGCDGRSDADTFYLFVTDPQGSFHDASISFPNGKDAKTGDVMFSYNE